MSDSELKRAASILRCKSKYFEIANWLDAGAPEDWILDYDIPSSSKRPQCFVVYEPEIKVRKSDPPSACKECKSINVIVERTYHKNDTGELEPEIVSTYCANCYHFDTKK